MYNLVFRDGHIEELNNKEADLILQMMLLGKEKFIFKKALHSFSSVQDIKPVNKEIYPILEAPKPILVNKKKYLKHLKDLRGGFLKHFGNRQLPDRSQSILDKMNIKIFEGEKLPENHKFTENVGYLFA